MFTIIGQRDRTRIERTAAAKGPRANRGSEDSRGDLIHVYAVSNGGAGTATFVGAANYGGARPDVGAAYGSQFTNSGYGLTVAGLAPGTYRLDVHARSTVTGTFNQARSVLITVH